MGGDSREVTLKRLTHLANFTFSIFFFYLMQNESVVGVPEAGRKVMRVKEHPDSRTERWPPQTLVELSY